MDKRILSLSAALLFACGGNPDRGNATGSLHARLSQAAGGDLAAVRIDILDGKTTVASRTLTPSATAPAGDAYFVLRAGSYVAMASPLDAQGQPSANCAAASAAAKIDAGKTTEIALNLFCQDQGTGGLDVIVTTDHGVSITDLKFSPSKFVATCSLLTIGVTAVDSDHDKLAWAWRVNGGPDGGNTTLAAHDAQANFSADKPGVYTLQVDVSDPDQHTATLIFPVHELDGGLCNVAPPVSFSVDPSLQPAAPLPGLGQGQPRPLAVFADSRGTSAEFVQDELLVSTDDTAALAALSARWSAIELDTIDMSTLGMPTLHLLQVDASAADESQLAGDLLALGAPPAGAHRFSSGAGFRLMAAAAHELRTSGLRVNLNFAVTPSSLSRRALAEAPAGASPYSPNPFDWTYMRAGGAQDIGVTEAWRDLALAGILTDAGSLRDLSRQVPMLIMDAGFTPNADFPAGWQMFPAAQLNVMNSWGCSTGAGCDWHGTDVVQTAMGTINNGFGTAGPAGPVARPLMVQSPARDVAQIVHYLVSALPSALSERPRIVNMSFEVNLPTIAFPVMDLFSAFTAHLRSQGMLVFAAAGNHGIDVDRTETTCFLVCVTYRPTLVLPCTNDGVTCVGGLDWDSTSRAGGSNYGESRDPHSGTVAMFAPYTVWMGQDPENIGNFARQDSGTSFSSPFVAGVAALVMAANPALTVDQVEQILLDTAHTGSPDASVPRWVNAHAAVRRALGGTVICEPPNVTIASPSDGYTLQAGESVTFTGSAIGLSEGALPGSALSWLDNGAALGSGFSVTESFASPGDHVVTLTARGCSAITGQASIRVHVVAAPAANASRILSPGDGAGFLVDASDGSGFYKDVALSGDATNSDGSAVPPERLHWSYTLNGVRTEIGNGNTPTARLANNGCTTLDYVITLEVLDSSGAVIPALTRSITVHIFNAPC